MLVLFVGIFLRNMRKVQWPWLYWPPVNPPVVSVSLPCFVPPSHEIMATPLTIEIPFVVVLCMSILLLPERDYVTFGSLLSQFRLSVVCRLSVTLVHPTQAVEPFGKLSSPLCTLASL